MVGFGLIQGRAAPRGSRLNNCIRVEVVKWAVGLGQTWPI